MRDPVSPFLSILLCLLLVFPTAGGSQEASNLDIVIVAGHGAVHDLGKGLVTPPVVEVRDRQGNLVEGARVLFSCPLSGPSGTFYGASRSTSSKTDQSGRASAEGFMPNGELGDYAIEVAVDYQGQQATVSIPQTNFADPVPVRPNKKVFGWRLITAILAGVAIAITAVILRNNESSGSASGTGTNSSNQGQ